MSPDQLNDFVTGNVILLMLAFARIGTAMIMMPGFGEMRVPARVKIALAFILSFIVFQTLPLPPRPDSISVLVALIAVEALSGAFIGIAGRIFLVTFHFLGAQIGFAAGLSNALAPPDANFDGANTIASLMHIAGIALIFATDTHHIMIGGILRSYEIIPVGNPIIEDMTEQLARIGGSAFYLAAALGAPFIIFSILVNLALGLANRVMPSMQVFFVAGPGLIILGFIILALLVPAVLSGVIAEMGNWYIELLR